MPRPTKPVILTVTPRRVASVSLLGAAVWFAYISPKTPLEFFDAGVRDRSAAERRVLAWRESIDPTGTSQVREMEDPQTYRTQMERLALTHDLANDRTHVMRERSSIIEGHYTVEEPVDALLRRENRTYRELASRWEVSKGKSITRTRLLNDLNKELGENSLFLMVFGTELTNQQFRLFQASIFWRASQ